MKMDKLFLNSFRKRQRNLPAQPVDSAAANDHVFLGRISPDIGVSEGWYIVRKGGDRMRYCFPSDQLENMHYPYSNLFLDVQSAKRQLEQILAPGPDDPGDKLPRFEIATEICGRNREEYEAIVNGSTSLC